MKDLNQIKKIAGFLVFGLLFGSNVNSQCPNVPEICNNGIDDDCDGLIDCFDGDCSGSQSCATFYFGRDSGECEVAPPVVTGFNLVEVWRSDVFVETRGTPIVGDLDGDGIPEVVTHYHDDNTVYILDGATGQRKHTIDAHLSDYSQSPAIADIDGDGKGEIFLIDNFGKLKCFDHLGQPKVGFVESTISKGQGTFADVFAGNVSFADFNGDGVAELYIGNEIYDAKTGQIVAQLADPYNSSKGANNVNSHVFSAAFDILPDSYCADCSGIELVCGNVVYSVNVNTGVLTEVSRAPNSVNDGRVSLADWDGDKQMDIIVTGFCCGDGGVIYIWDPRKQDFVTHDAGGNPLQSNPVDVQPNIGKATGLASIADFDGDGLLEIGLASHNEFITFESDLTRKWAIPAVDVSNMTTSTAFDFEGDGKVEVVYRDENHLYVFDGATGNVISKTDCGSGTRTELPIVVDVDGDGDAELVCNCADKSGGVRGNVRVYESDSSIWMPTRSVWNTHNYVPSFVNDDLTIPKQFQNKALIKGQDLYLAQTSLINKSGNPVYPVLPDYTVFIDSVAKNCASSANVAHVKICMQTANALVFDFDVSFYNGDPHGGGTLIGTQRVDHSASTIPASGCMTLTQSVDFGKYDLHVIVNDKGTNPANAPIVLMPECDTTNNSTYINLTDCSAPELISKDTLSICKGDTITIQTINLTNSNWTGDSLIVLNDSTAQVFPIDTTTYQLVHYVTRKELLVNSDFEDVNLAGTNAQLDASAVNGWNTTASDNKIEIWRDGFLGHSSYSGQFFAELNATQPSALYQDVSTTPGEIIRWGFAHKGRVTNETMQLNVGPAGGPYTKIGDFTDGPAAWRYYTGEYLVPAGQTLTRFLFSATDGNSSANLLDAATFEALIEYKDSIVVVVHDQPELNLKDSSICAGDSVQLDAQNSSSSYLWSTAETSQSITVKSSSSYNVAVTNSFGCTSRDTMNLSVNSCSTDASISKTDGRDDYTPGTTTQYRIVAKNLGPTDFKGGTVSDPLPMGISAEDVSWDVSVFGGASTATVGSQVGALNDVVSIPVGDSIVYSVNIAVPVGYKGDLENTATIIVAIDTNAANNTATDIDFNGLCVGATTSSFAEQFNTGVKINPGENDPNWTVQWVYEAAVNGGAAVKDFAPVTNNAILPAKGIVNAAPGFWIDANPPDYLWIAYPWTGWKNGDGLHGDLDGDGVINEWGNNVSGATGDAAIVKFSKTFEMTAAQVAASEISFEYAIDNYLTDVRVNGVSQGGLPHSTQYKTFESHTITQDFVIGTNTIDIYVQSGPPALGLIIRNSTIKAVDSVALIITDPPAICSLGSTDITDSLWTAGSINMGMNTYFIDSAGTIPYSSPTTADSGAYYIVTTAESGCTDTAKINVSTNPSPTVNLPNDTSFCVGDSIVVDANLATTWQWNTGDSTRSIAVDSAGTYKVTVTNAFGCSDSDSVAVTENPLPIIDIGPDGFICRGDSLQLNAKYPNANYLWNTNTTTEAINVSKEGDYHVLVTDKNGCKGRDTMALSYYMDPVVDLGADTSFCFPGSATINGGSWSQYLWNGGETSSTIVSSITEEITLNVVDSNGCKGADTINVTVHPLPIVQLGNDTTLCAGQSIELNASNQGGRFTWSSGSTQQSIIVTDEGLYWVQVTDGNNCIAQDSIVVSKDVIPDPYSKKEFEICEGETIVLQPDSGYDSYQINWLLLSDDTFLSINEAGRYESAVSSIHCSDTFELVVTEIRVPTVSLMLSPYSELFCFEYETATIVSSTESLPALSYLWSTGDTLPEITVDSGGVYQLTIYNYHCGSSEEIEINNYCPGVLYLPNAFTPDGDGLNDVFTAEGSQITDFRLEVFNRWGQLIFTSNDMQTGWDGTYQNRPVQQEVYVYKVHYSFLAEHGGAVSDSKVGTVTLVR